MDKVVQVVTYRHLGIICENDKWPAAEKFILMETTDYFVTGHYTGRQKKKRIDADIFSLYFDKVIYLHYSRLDCTISSLFLVGSVIDHHLPRVFFLLFIPTA